MTKKYVKINNHQKNENITSTTLNSKLTTKTQIRSNSQVTSKINHQKQQESNNKFERKQRKARKPRKETVKKEEKNIAIDQQGIYKTTHGNLKETTAISGTA